jgi:hypothetical protein
MENSTVAVSHGAQRMAIDFIGVLRIVNYGDNDACRRT